MWDAGLAKGIWYGIQPGLQAMTLFVRTSNATPTFTSYAIAYAKSRPLTGAEIRVSGGLLPYGSRLISVFIDALNDAGAPIPKTGDYWVDSNGDAWVITPDGVELRMLDSFVECTTARQVPGS
jgi:hypothetical protein